MITNKFSLGEIRFLIIFILIIILLIGCASTQKIKVNSNPSGANVFVNNVPMGITNTNIKLNKKEKENILRVEKKGYESKEISLKRKFSCWRVVRLFTSLALLSTTRIMLEGTTKGNVISTATGLLAGSVAGLYYGISSGDFYKFKPSKINITLKESENQEIYPPAKSNSEINDYNMDTIDNDGSFKVVEITKIQTS